MNEERGTVVVIVPKGGQSNPWETLELARDAASQQDAVVDESVPPRVQTGGVVGNIDLDDHDVEAVFYEITRFA